MIKPVYLCTLLLVLISVSCINDDVVMLSPGSIIRLELISGNSSPAFTLSYRGINVPMELFTDPDSGRKDIPSTVSITENTPTDLSWEAINGKNRIVRNTYNSYRLKVTREQYSADIIFRLYDDGLAYRFEIAGEGKEVITEESGVRFSEDITCWAYNGENHNIGPLEFAENEYEFLRPPVTIQTSGGLYAALLEASISELAPSVLDCSDNKSFTFRILQDSANLPLRTSWRVLQLAVSPGELLESDILVNLNEECRIKNPEWIKPGKVVWDWRVWGYQAPDGFEYGLNTPSHKRLVDFAAENNIQYLLLDADWYGPEFDESSDPASSNSHIEIGSFMDYASGKGVGIILYLNDVAAKKFGLERILKQFSEWGVSGVKYGFMRGSWEEKVAQTRKVVELCAEYSLMVNFHDNPVPPSGDRRTWPNLMTKEFCHSQADAHRSYYPETIVSSVFVNMLAGPLDMCNGWFDLNNAHSRVKVFQELPGTVAAELAKLVVVYSGWHILPDAPEEYLEKDDLFEFVRIMPPEFENYKVLKGEIGEYISVARKSGDDWFIGTLTNRMSRNMSIKLDFLDKGFKYSATLYEDSSETHYLNNKEVYSIRDIEDLRAGDTLDIHLAEGGGNAIVIKRIVE